MIQAIKEIKDEITKDVITTNVSRRALPLPAPGSDDHIPDNAKQVIETPDKTIRFVPVYGKYAIRNFCGEKFSEVIENMDAIMGQTAEDINFDKMLSDILNGNMFLWIIFVNNKYSGIMTVSWEMNPFTPKYFDIRQLFIRKGIDIDLDKWTKAMKAVDDYAIRWGFDKSRMYTCREGWEKKLKRYKWKKTYNVYEKDLRS